MSYSSTTPFSIQYGSGAARGVLGQDTVSLAQYTVSDQVFALVTEASDDLLTDPYSGLMGLGWASLATSQATPFWQALATQGKLETPAMSFYLARYRDQQFASSIEPEGGLMTLGYLNDTLYEGKINYINLEENARDYWRIPIQGIRVGNTAISISSNVDGSLPNAAIDTGTTLIGGPPSVVQAIYSAIPGARPLNLQNFPGYYEYPCSQSVNFTMQFGSVSYAISEADFNLGPFTTDFTYCTGGVFEQKLSSNSPISWIVGATFLKNVYSVFQYNPAAIGFATLVGESQVATTASGGAAVPSPTETLNPTVTKSDVTPSNAGLLSSAPTHLGLVGGIIASLYLASASLL